MAASVRAEPGSTAGSAGLLALPDHPEPADRRPEVRPGPADGPAQPGRNLSIGSGECHVEARPTMEAFGRVMDKLPMVRRVVFVPACVAHLRRWAAIPGIPVAPSRAGSSGPDWR